MITIINRNGAGSLTLVKNGNSGALIMTSATVPVTSAILTGTTSIVAQSPFAGGGNSYLLPASSTSYVYVPGQIGYAFGTGDFTIEWFQYETDTNNAPRVFWYGSSPSIGISLEGGVYNAYYVWAPTGTSLGTKGSIKDSWHHYALVRISGILYLYKNGTIVNPGGTSYTVNITDTTSNFVWGAKPSPGLSSEQFGGYLTNMRIVKGLGVYIGNFTAPTSALTAISSANPYGGSNTVAVPDGYTKLLLVP